MGLGLAIVKTILNLHNTSLEIKVKKILEVYFILNYRTTIKDCPYICKNITVIFKSIVIELFL